MTIQFELNLDSDGRPCIKFTHQDKDNCLEQRILGVFVNSVKEKGMCLVSPSGHIDSQGFSFEKYEIQIKK